MPFEKWTICVSLFPKESKIPPVYFPYNRIRLRNNRQPEKKDGFSIHFPHQHFPKCEAEEYFSNKAIAFIEKNIKNKKINVKALLKEDKIIQEYIILNFLRQGITHGKDISKKQIEEAMS